jgi:hypothetical protein
MVAVSFSILGRKDEAIKWTLKEYDLRCEAFGKSHSRTKRTRLSLRSLKMDVYGVDDMSDSEDDGSNNAQDKGENDGDILLYSASHVDPQSITWDLDPFELDEKFTVDSILQMFHASGCVRAFNIPNTNLSRLVLAARKGYHNNNSFHNWRHAWSVTMSVYLIAMSPNVLRCLGPSDRLAVLVAAMLHDIDHPGVNNDFLIKSADPLARKFPTPNVLERHHWGECEKLLEEGSPTDILVNLDHDERQRMMEMIYSGIMATDMVCFLSFVRGLNEHIYAAHAAGSMHAYLRGCRASCSEICTSESSK